jgi:hypothetical protein
MESTLCLRCQRTEYNVIKRLKFISETGWNVTPNLGAVTFTSLVLGAEYESSSK